MEKASFLVEYAYNVDVNVFGKCENKGYSHDWMSFKLVNVGERDALAKRHS